MIQDFVGITGMAKGITGNLMLFLETAIFLQKNIYTDHIRDTQLCIIHEGIKVRDILKPHILMTLISTQTQMQTSHHCSEIICECCFGYPKSPNY